MQIPLTSITEGSRMRVDYGDLEALKSSLSTLGQLQSILVDDNFNLIAGGRRYRAMVELGWDTCQVITASDVSEDMLRTMELEENIQRKDMDWKEQCLNIAAIVLAQQKRAAQEGGKYTYVQAGKLLGLKYSSVSYYVKIAKGLADHDEELALCSSVTEAIKLLISRQENLAYEQKTVLSQLALANRHGNIPGQCPTLASTGGPIDFDSLPELDDDTLPDLTIPRLSVSPTVIARIDVTRHCILDDSVYIKLPSLPSSCVDHIITDIPYGIDMDNLNTNKRLSVTENEHDVDENVSLMEPFLTQAFRVLRDKGFCIFFFDLNHFNHLMTLARRIGFGTQDWPLIWQKTTASRNSAAHVNWTKNYESIMVLRKGICTLNSVQSSSVILGGLTTPERSRFNHPFTKPYNVVKQLVDAIGIPGQTILDPFAGEFSIVCHLLKLGYDAIGIEKMAEHHTKGVSHVQQTIHELSDPLN